MSWPLIEFTIELGNEPVLVYANETVSKITGYSIVELNQLVSSPEKIVQLEDLMLLQNLLNEKNFFVLPIRIIDAKGNTKWIEIAAKCARKRNKKLTLKGCGWDISRYHIYSEKLSLEVANQFEKLQENKYFTQSLLKAKEEERIKIANEIHDNLGQVLTALNLELSLLYKTTRSRKTKESLKGLLEMVSEAVQIVRRVSSELHPSVIDHLGLYPAIEYYATTTAKRAGFMLNLELPHEPEPRLTQHEKIFIYRILQEALTNIVKHAGATNVSIGVVNSSNNLQLTIADNGKGFEPEKAQEKLSLGLTTMKQRAETLNGKLTLISKEGEGTEILLNLPIKR